MNYLSGGYLGRGIVKYLPTSCCQETQKSLACNGLAKKGTSLARAVPCTSAVGRVLLCQGALRNSPTPAVTQVRFQKCHPRFHNDMEFPNMDHYRKDAFVDVRKTKWGSEDKKPGAVNMITLIGLLGGAYGLKATLTHYISYMAPAADVLAMASVEVDVSNVAEGSCMTVKWRGKPLFIKRRTKSEMDVEALTPMANLRDPETSEKRCPNPEWLVVIGICTHLGCVPVPNSGDYTGGFYCPCHGSHYDNLGRIRKGPAPTNLEVPPYKFITDTQVVVG